MVDHEVEALLEGVGAEGCVDDVETSPTCLRDRGHTRLDAHDLFGSVGQRLEKRTSTAPDLEYQPMRKSLAERICDEPEKVLQVSATESIVGKRGADLRTLVVHD
jgi:hypothetical protein